MLATYAPPLGASAYRAGADGGRSGGEDAGGADPRVSDSADDSAGDGAWLRLNFVSSLDGAATREGLSGGLGRGGDKRVFDLQRRWADVVLVGAGTARAEGYGAMALDDEAVAWRRAQGLAPHPVFALVTGRLDLDPASPIFAEAPVRPLVYTVASAPAEARSALSAVAEVVDAGETSVDPAHVRADLAARGLLRIHAEGGPSLFGAFLTAGVVDELCLTIAPTVEGGSAGRIAHADAAAPTDMRPASVLLSGDGELLLRHVRA
ncbi:pyrimidine reductase family protein [Schumannella soli]|uniref:Pyrimidine reductase family protein n=1 Tax=Schumannella soli TaxID=2590779 RepID=A0A506XWY2_9MICO|nr:pyrimidine reductase family protein [Schumannella soli]